MLSAFLLRGTRHATHDMGVSQQVNCIQNICVFLILNLNILLLLFLLRQPHAPQGCAGLRFGKRQQADPQPAPRLASES